MGIIPQRNLKEEADLVIQELMTLVQHTVVSSIRLSLDNNFYFSGCGIDNCPF